MENIAEYYFEQLHNSTSPGVVLAKLFCQLFDKEINKSDFVTFGRLVKLYGRFITYFAILDFYGVPDANALDPLPLLYFFCKKRLEQKNPEVYNGAYKNLDSKITKLEEEIRKQTEKNKLKIKDID